MLIIVDMQNRILDEDDECFVPGATQLIPRIKHRLQQARLTEELVIYTRDVPVEFKNKDEENFALQIIPELAPLASEIILKKHYFTLPPKQLLKIQALPEVAGQKTIELVGTELQLCVLANTLALQSIFPEADFVIVPKRVAGRKMTEDALALLKDFNVQIK
ncbi:isochorismatase family protein [Enterococcus diestrammenae]|uniref:Isochorismatase-like domain-containing protein n=1 Tax=Enterococcus diestrammenae TaxID=1155073 RepID=A0ABV0F000_9ENTE|nr:isochorismatase family protein [Enterococcus diestrammenae]KAF1298506.1 hypothetical protein BAU18_01230 [Enterococcus diestrammenae]